MTKKEFICSRVPYADLLLGLAESALKQTQAALNNRKSIMADTHPTAASVGEQIEALKEATAEVLLYASMLSLIDSPVFMSNGVSKVVQEKLDCWVLSLMEDDDDHT